MSLTRAQRTQLYLELKQSLYGSGYLDRLGELHDRFIGLGAEDLNCFAKWAVKAGDEKIIELFQLTCTRIPPMRRETETAVHVAARSVRQIVSIDALFDLYTFRNYVDAQGLTHFHVACLIGNMERMTFYWSCGDVDLNATLIYGPRGLPKTALQLAVGCLRWNAIEWMVYNGACLEKRDSTGLTPLNELCLRIGCFDDRRDTADRYLRTFVNLLHLGADVNTTDIAGNSPLLNLFHKGVLADANFELQLICFRQLVIHGADVAFKNSHGDNLYHYIAANTPRFFSHDRMSKERLEWVMERLFPLLGSNAIDHSGNTPLNLAVARVHSQLVKVFLGNRDAPRDADEEDADRDAAANGNEDADRDADEDANGHADADAVEDPHRVADENGLEDADRDADEDANGQADDDAVEDPHRGADERARAVVNTINLQQLGLCANDDTELPDLVTIDNCLRTIEHLNTLPNWGWTWDRKNAIWTFLKGARQLTPRTDITRVLHYGSYSVIETYLRSFIMSPDYPLENKDLHRCIFEIWKFATIIDIGELHKEPQLTGLLEEASLHLKARLPEDEREKDLFNMPVTTMGIASELRIIQGRMLRGARSLLEFCQTEPRHASVTWHLREGIARILPGRLPLIEGFVHGHIAKSIRYQLFDEDDGNPADAIFASDEDNL
ncbi:uncharacterized protein LOC106655195 isoform X2 [Trichogramma pretiosum]|uniref:uncharacterized protein LOC106655195 isoform X2 n=1 Tax=Trichogramma pretiosum TaxID=7493 RepID=UPI000C71C6F2|nr:uncharacterized protein LOC106655195 isoform X2 [Trichogramma pretiosum]